MASVYINDSNYWNPYKFGNALSQPFKSFKINSQENFIFYGALDGPNNMIPIPCYKTNKVTIDGERVYYPAMSLADAKAFKDIGNKPFLTREDKSVMAKVSQALDKCAESYGLASGSISLKNLFAFYEYFERSEKGGAEYIADLKRASATSST